MAEMPHMKRREGDEWYCPRCNTRWSDHEEAPSPCIENRERSTQSAANAARALALGSRTASQRKYWGRVEKYHLTNL